MLLVLSLITLAVFVFYFGYSSVQKPYKFPPGPTWYPLIGCIFQFYSGIRKYKLHYKVFVKFAERYGNVVGFKFGRNMLVSISGYEAISEALANEDLNGRPDGFFFKARTFGKRLGVVFTDGEQWERTRKFTTQHLRMFGLGRKDMESRIVQEIQEFIQLIKEGNCPGQPPPHSDLNGSTTAITSNKNTVTSGKSGKSEVGNGIRKTEPKPVAVQKLFDVGVVNVLWAMIAGERYAHNDKRLGELLSAIHEAFGSAEPTGGVLNQVPAVRHVAPVWSGYTQLIKIHKRLWQFFQNNIDEHRKTFCKSHSRDLIDAYLEKIDSNSDEDFTEQHLLAVCMDLFMAGSETTNNTLAFAVRYLIEYPEIQNKIHQELDTVIGKNRCAALQDKADLPYLNAFIMEVMRVVNVPPLGIPRRAMCDTTVLGHRIPEGATVLFNLYTLHMDSAHWPEPEVFRPERFLDAAGKCFTPDKYFIPFGTGKRRCLGESLAKSNVFLFLSAILHNFVIEIDPNNPVAGMECEGSFTLSPKQFYAIFQPRGV